MASSCNDCFSGKTTMHCVCSYAACHCEQYEMLAVGHRKLFGELMSPAAIKYILRPSHHVPDILARFQPDS